MLPLTLGPLARGAMLWVVLAGCGDHEIGVIEALPAPNAVAPDGAAPDAVAPDGAAPDAGPQRAPPKPPAPTAAPLPEDRGRVQVRDGNLLTDKGTRLRGVTFGVDAEPDGLPLESGFFAQLSHEAGLNALHIFLENYADETGVNVSQADALVELTSAAGMYLLLGIGGGDAGGTFSIDKVRSFWGYYAPRYAARTHVMFDIQNFPDTTCDGPYLAETLAMEREAYELIRNVAPSTHIAVLSFGSTPTASALESNLDALEGTVEWANASVAFSAIGCAGQDYLADLLAGTRSRGIATITTFPTNLETVARLESERTGWFNFDWLVFDRDLAAFREQHEAAGITWCPDFGSWPQDSQTCSTP